MDGTPLHLHPMPSTRALLVSRLRKARGQLPYLARGLALAWQPAPVQAASWIALVVIQGLLPALSVTLTRALVDGVVAAVRPGTDLTAAAPGLGLLVAAIAGLALTGEGLRSASGWLRAAHSERVQDHISGLIHAKSVEVDLAFYDLPDYFDHLHRARSEASYRPMALLTTAGNLLQSVVTLAAMGALLLAYGPLLSVVLVLSTLPALYVVVGHAVRQHAWRNAHTQTERRAWYDDWLLTAREMAAELRLFGLGPRFQKRYQDTRAELRAGRARLNRDQALAELAVGAAALAVTAGAMLWMGWRVLTGGGSLGDLVLFYQVFSQGQQLARGLLQELGQIYTHSLFLNDLFAFLELQPTITAPARPAAPPAPPYAVAFRNVSFRYPGHARPALNGFSLSVPAGTSAALVGVNGAGKSTLVKLLCRFYDPDAGQVEIGGLDVRDWPLDALRRGIGALFQQPAQYDETAADNIALGAWPEAALPEALRRAAADAGADAVIERLPGGFDALLGTWFAGGTDLSTGEWQRIALARAYLRQAPLLLLDEPTSALDPWAEDDWLARFRALSAGRTAIVITHRFTTARYADRIHVVDGGRVVEAGSHAELLALGGRYAASWRAQTRGSAEAAVGDPP